MLNLPLINQPNGVNQRNGAIAPWVGGIDGKGSVLID
jgi:hypothetical protein